MSTVDDLKSRIATEAEKLRVEEAREVALTASRVEPLRAGDDNALDDIESQIDICRGSQLRIQERLELLQTSLGDAVRETERAGLEKVAAEADVRRKAAEKLLRTKYPKLARELVALLTEIAAEDAAIARANRRLEMGGLDQVPPVNLFRHRQGFMRKVVSLEMISARDPRHPDFEHIEYNRNAKPYDRRTNTPVVPVAMEIERKEWVNHFSPVDLLQAVVIPGLLETDGCFWPPVDPLPESAQPRFENGSTSDT